MFSITEKIIDDDFIRELKNNLKKDENGASVIFEGIVRNHNDGKKVNSLEYSAYVSMAEKEGNKIIKEAYQKYKITEAISVHRIGHLKINELAVWVIATAHHRQEAFLACQYIIDNIKFKVPIWKCEHYESGEREWVACHNCAEPNKTLHVHHQGCGHNHD